MKQRVAYQSFLLHFQPFSNRQNTGSKWSIIRALYKGGYSLSEHNSSANRTATDNNPQQPVATNYSQFKTRIDVVHIANTYGCVFVWIRFWDSLRLSTLAATEIAG